MYKINCKRRLIKTEFDDFFLYTFIPTLTPKHNAENRSTFIFITEFIVFTKVLKN